LSVGSPTALTSPSRSPRGFCRQGDDILPIPGTTSIEHLLDDLGAANVRLSPEVLARLDALINQNTVSGDRYSDQANREVDTEVFAAS
jgi:diketogulonate reductase-like aldo/keto reductase